MKIAVVCISIIVILLASPCSLAEDISDLEALISSFEDSYISVRDLAFYLVSHNYDAEPEDGYVQLQLDGKVYRLVPNGDLAGLCDISLQT